MFSWNKKKDFRFSGKENGLIIHPGHREALCECKLEMDIRRNSLFKELKNENRNKEMGQE